MHIVHLIARLNDGGPARVIAAIAAMLPAPAWRHTVLCGACAPGEPDLAPVLRAAGLAVCEIPGLGRSPSPWRDGRAFLALRAQVRSLRPDVLHTHTAKAGALGRVLARLEGIACVHTYHGHVLHGYFPPAVDALLAAAERVLAGRHHHHALTESQASELRDRHGIGRRERWRVLPPPVVPVAPVAAPWHAELVPDLPVVGFLGRLAPVKDVGLFCDTVTELARQQPVQALICGEGPERTVIEARRAGLGCPLLVTGQVPAGEALAVMQVLLMTSRNEGLPLAAVEALGAGVPVVAPPVGGLADLVAAGAVHGAARTPAGLAAAVAAALAAPLDAARGQAFAASLAPAALAPAYAALYRSVARS